MSENPPASGVPDESVDWEALARHLAGEGSVEEADEVRRWLAEEPGRQQLFHALDRPIRRLAHGPPADLDVEAALARVSARLETADVLPLEPRIASRAARARTGWATAALRAAAVVVLLVGGALFLRGISGGDPMPGRAAARSYATAVGERDSLRLPDGTRVLLGPGSRLEVPAEYGGADRTVQLSGEALFEVADAGGPPFTVRAGEAAVRDLGTAFTVRGGSSAAVQVVVTSGSVVLFPAADPEERGVVLHAGDHGLLEPGAPPVATRPTAPEDVLAWTRGELVFRGTPLREVGEDLRRWYGVELRVADPALAARRLTATFAGEPRSRVLEVIALTLGAEVELRGDTAVLRPAGGTTR